MKEQSIVMQGWEVQAILAGRKTQCGMYRNQHVGSVRGCFGGTGNIFSTNTYRGGFAWLWDQTNGKKHPWSANPWVWVVTFKPVEVAN